MRVQLKKPNHKRINAGSKRNQALEYRVNRLLSIEQL
jgi:hypothetical protein